MDFWNEVKLPMSAISGFKKIKILSEISPFDFKCISLSVIFSDTSAV